MSSLLTGDGHFTPHLTCQSGSKAGRTHFECFWRSGGKCGSGVSMCVLMHSVPHAADTPDGLTTSDSPLLCVSLYLSPSIHRGPTQVRQHIFRPELWWHLPGQTCPRLKTAKKVILVSFSMCFFGKGDLWRGVSLLWKSSTSEWRSVELRRLARWEQNGEKWGSELQ